MTAVSFVTPPGRLISGSTTELQKSDHQNRPKPQDKWNYFIGLAVRKDDPNVGAFIQQIGQMIWSSDYSRQPHILQNAQNVMQRGFPSGNVGFAWKISDGDQPGANGQVYEHSKGCWVFKFSSMFALKCCDANNKEIDPANIKRGYYVDISGNMSINGNTDGTAGIYLNPSWIRLLGYGPEIVGGPTAEQAFGAAPAALPTGASATPVAGPSAGAPGGGFPGNQPQQQAPAGFPGTMPQTTVAPQQQPYMQPQQQAPMGFPGGQPQQMPPQSVGGFQQPPANGLPTTGFPSNPQTGLPVQPHNGFIPGNGQ